MRTIKLWIAFKKTKKIPDNGYSHLNDTVGA